jgi:hypothetical protein
MNPFSMTVLIVLIVAVAKVMSRRYQSLGGHHHQTVQSADTIRAQDEIRQLKERVAVLERVVTDSHGSIGLGREIERLRDR